MKALTIWQPWASLIACGDKSLELRRWHTKYRGPVVIHAAKRPYREKPHWRVADLPYGAFIAYAELTDVRPAVPDDWRAAGVQEVPPDYFAWQFLVLHTFEPIPCLGAQRLWKVPVDMEQEIEYAPFVVPPDIHDIVRRIQVSRKTRGQL